MLRYPSLRAPIDVLFLICCVGLTAIILVPEIWGHGKTKDYPLWYWAGQQVLAGKDLYPKNISDYFEFIYPPLSAVLLALVAPVRLSLLAVTCATPPSITARTTPKRRR